MRVVTSLLLLLTLTTGHAYHRDSNRKRKEKHEKVIENSFIVHLNSDEVTPKVFKERVHAHLHARKLTDRAVRIHEIEHLFQGVIVKGLTRQELEELPHVKKIVPDKVAHLRGNPSLRARALDTSPEVPKSLPAQYDLDRLDQNTLPLDNSYNPKFTGSNVDVYIVDTGIDTSHIEFQKRSGLNRVVKNVYDAYAIDPLKPTQNNDGNGHGTHVAGTVGGNTVGVSPDANIYGVRVLDDYGYGSNADIIHGLEYIYKTYKASPRRTVVSMSLGSDCEQDECSDDALVNAVETLASNGIIVSVAAGNEGCNACHSSPNAAPSAVNVGASNRIDELVGFSNYGQCVDIIAPGYDIRSACALNVCGNYNSYETLAGTSMACPHVSGVIAQILQKLDKYYKTAQGKLIPITSDRVKAELSCYSSKNQLTLDTRDTITKNMLLHIPETIRADNRLQNTLSPTCAYSSGCPSGCSNHGYCLATYLAETQSTENRCYCDPGYYGDACELSQPPTCNPFQGDVSVTMYMIDTFGDGWTESRYAITDEKGLVVDDAFDALCYGHIGSRKYCLSEGTYELNVTRGAYASDIGWKICGDVSGSAPYYGLLEVKDNQCLFKCPADNILTTLEMSDLYADGWNGAYLSLTAVNTGIQHYGAALLSGPDSVTKWCLTPGEYDLVFEVPGRHANEIKFDICNHTFTYTDSIIRLSIDKDKNCQWRYVQDIPLNNGMNTTTPVAVSSCASDSSDITFHLIDKDLSNWSQNQIILTPYDESTLIHTSVMNNDTSYSYTLPDFFYTEEVPNPIVISTTQMMIDGGTSSSYLTLQHTCIPDGCYKLGALPKYLQNNTELYVSTTQSWSVCGYYGKVPEFTHICVDSRHQLCYGLDRNLYMKSYTNLIDEQSYYITTIDTVTKDEIIVDMDSISGVKSLNNLLDGTYHIHVGAGSYYSSTNERNTVWICGHTFTLPYDGILKISDYQTQCSTTPLPVTPVTKDTTCVMKSTDNVSSTIPVMLIKASVATQGWGEDGSYEIYLLSDSESDMNESQLTSATTTTTTTTTTIRGIDSKSAVQPQPSFHRAAIKKTSIHHSFKNMMNNVHTTGSAQTSPLDRIQPDNVLNSMYKHRARQQPSSTTTHRVLNSVSNTSENTVVSSGTLSSGQFESDTLCLEIGQCYYFSVYSNTPQDVIWQMCGHVGGDYDMDGIFCVTDTGCEFIY